MIVSTMAEDWDATAYDRVAGPQTRWGSAVVERLDLRGDERVLDAGCGTGRVTELVLRRLPRGHVVAVDSSEAMLAEAGRRLAALGDRVTLLPADLGEPLAPVVGAPVDAVLSTATLHWVVDHDALFANLASVLRPGGALVAQCGGHGNVASALAVAAELGASPGPVNFATAEATAARLRAAGFGDIWTWLQPEPTVLTGPELEEFLATVVLRTHLAGLPGPERAAFTGAVAARLVGAEVDFVRLNILARRI
ncbi:MAG: methyltransferase domain-containing protein [Actinomycetota bacterium]